MRLAASRDGFKFCSVAGEVLTDPALVGEAAQMIDPLRLPAIRIGGAVSKASGVSDCVVPHTS